MTLVMPALKGLTDSEKAAVMKRLGLSAMTENTSWLSFENSMDNARKEALLKRAQEEKLAVLPVAESLEELEAYAVGVLGMQRCSPGQIIYIEHTDSGLNR